MSLCVIVNDLVKLFEVDGTTLVDVDGVEPLLVALLVPVLSRIGVTHKFFAEASALIDIQVTIAIVVSLTENSMNHGSELLACDLGLLGLFDLFLT